MKQEAWKLLDALISNLFSSVCKLGWQRWEMLLACFSQGDTIALNWEFGKDGGLMLSTMPELRREREWVMVQMPQILAVLSFSRFSLIIV